MRSLLNDKAGRFAPFWIMFAVLGILLIGSFITPFKISLDSIFENIENNAVNNGDSRLSCTADDAYWYMKSTCFTLGGFMVVFVLYLLYNWVSGMVAGSQSPTPVFSQKHRAIQALES